MTTEKNMMVMFLLSIIFTGLWGQTAVQPANFGETGAGSENNPFEISSWQNLYWISQNTHEWDKHYIQTDDIAFPADIENWDGGAGWKPIGNSTTGFSGVYDGQGFIINGLYINRTSNNDDNLGMFGITDGAEILNLGLSNVNILGGRNNRTGGLVGTNNGSSTINSCFTTGNVKGNQRVGGLAGQNESGSLIINCYSSANIEASNNFIGGMVGRNEGQIENSYSIGIVVGHNNTGGLVGSGGGTVVDSYWDMESSGQTESAGGTGKTTVDMLTLFDNWDSEIWSVEEGFTYPYLAGQSQPSISNFPSMNMENSGNNIYTKTLGPQGSEVTATFAADENDDGNSLITFTYTANPAHPALANYPEHDSFVGFYGFCFGDDQVLHTGQEFILQFLEEPDNLRYRYGNSNWAVLDSEMFTGPALPNYSYTVNIQSLPEVGREQVCDIEFASDRDEDQPLPVELSSFTAQLTSDMSVILSWRAESETNLLGYNIYRSIVNSLADSFKKNSVIISASNSSFAVDYSYTDQDVIKGQRYYYWLESVDLDLTSQFHGPVSVMIEQEEFSGTTPESLENELIGAFPNPFNPGTNISFSLAEPARVSLNIYNIQGQVVRRLIEDKMYEKGIIHVEYWDGSGQHGKVAGSGVYFYKIQTDCGYEETKMMLLMK